MRELAVVVSALAFSGVFVWLVHRFVMQHVAVRAKNKIIVSMEAVAFGSLVSSFLVGEAVSLTKVLIEGSKSGYHVALTLHDVFLVMGTLAASVLIYIAASIIE